MSGREAAQSKRSTSRLTKTQRAGIIFPVSRVLRFMRAGPFFKYRIAAGAPVYMAAVMEYLCAEVMIFCLDLISWLTEIMFLKVEYLCLNCTQL